jgi:hypothetical protein
MEPYLPDEDNPRSRKASVLTMEDREFLWKHPDKSGSAAAKRRQRLIRRIRDGLLDLAFVFDRLPEKYKERVFTDPEAGILGRTPLWLPKFGPDIIGLIFQARYDSATIKTMCRYFRDERVKDPDDSPAVGNPIMAFEELIERGVKRAILQAGWVVDVDVQIDIRPRETEEGEVLDVDELAERVRKHGRDAVPVSLLDLVRAGALTTPIYDGEIGDEGED